MITIDIKGVDAVAANMAKLPKQASKAAESAIDFTAKHIQADEKKEILTSFESPVDYTLNSVKTTLTKRHNMEASVWIATPPRMEDSYLVPQVEGGSRKLKGFERGLDGAEFVPGAGAKLNAAGNIPVATIKKALAGANEKRSPGYVHIKKRHGKLWPGVYQRFKTTNGFNRETNKHATRIIQRGRMRGRFASAVSARGLKPIMLEGRTGHKVKPEFDFYGVARKTFEKVFAARFQRELDMQVRK